MGISGSQESRLKPGHEWNCRAHIRRMPTQSKSPLQSILMAVSSCYRNWTGRKASRWLVAHTNAFGHAIFQRILPWHSMPRKYPGLLGMLILYRIPNFLFWCDFDFILSNVCRSHWCVLLIGLDFILFIPSTLVPATPNASRCAVRIYFVVKSTAEP